MVNVSMKLGKIEIDKSSIPAYRSRCELYGCCREDRLQDAKIKSYRDGMLDLEDKLPF